MTGNRTTGAAMLVAALVAAGVKRLFTLSGNQILAIYDACLDAGIELIHVRHEAAAVHMADAWGRLTGEPGVALVSAGPGHANALSGLFVAREMDSPLVLISGHAPARPARSGEFQQMRQAEMAAPVTKRSWTASDATALGHDFMRAFTTAMAGRAGPVHLSVPADLLERAVARDGCAPLRIGSVRPRALAPRLAARIVRELARARRPLILAGPALMRGAGVAALDRLKHTTLRPIVPMESPRGINDPSLGAFAEIVGEADLVVLLGKKLDYTLRLGGAGTFSDRCRFIQIDPDRVVLNATRVVVGGRRIVLTAQATLGAAIERLETAARSCRWKRRGWTEEVDAAVAYRPPEWQDVRSRPEGPLHPVEVCGALQPWLADEGVAIADGGEFGQWAQALVRASRRLINGLSGGIGNAVPFAIAARLAAPRARVVALSGDGGFGFHALESDTAVRYGLPFVVVVGNDAAWNAEVQSQRRRYGADRTIGCELLPSRYEDVFRALGGHGEHVRTRAELAPALERAFLSGKPACVNVLIDPVPAPIVRRAPPAGSRP